MRPNFYSHSGLDRVSHLRKEDAWLEVLVRDPRTRVVPVWRAQNLFRPFANAAEPPAPLMPTVDTAAHLLNGDALVILLGMVADVAHIALDLSHIGDPASVIASTGQMGEFADLRRHGPSLERQAGSILAYARGIVHWHSRHRFCGVCGFETRSAQAGHVRICINPDCNTQHFPRTDPAVIMLVTDGERCLLGRQAVWMPGMHSTLAGFVEPGESFEEAVAREVFEETGIRVGNVHYHSSQPWPFPASIMIGFHADAETTRIDVDRSELEDARWFERRQLLESPEDETFRLPRRDSIARRLVESWLGRD
ncbi:MAG TPA: NAD(+) diphosphatase [Alphaproteobacteria bacterium]|nr:NAD(+) diphosphatase [Alphaproteobacteria bacterium]